MMSTSASALSSVIPLREAVPVKRAAWSCSRSQTAGANCALPTYRVRTKRGASVRVQADSKSNGDAPMSEDTLQAVLKRLEVAEAEASRLKADLAAAQKTTDGKTADELVRMKPAPLSTGLRTDGTTARLGGIPAGSKGKESSWLTEEDITFYTRGGATEAEKLLESGATADQAGTVTRRLLIGAAATAVFAVLALQPDGALTGAPPKPLFFYLVPILRVQRLLPEIEEIVADARWEDLAIARKRVLGEPNNLKENLFKAAAALEDKQRGQQAKDLGQLVVEYVNDSDYIAYFDTIGKPTGTENARFADFSSKAVRAAGVKLTEFLKLMPAEDVEAARSQLDAFAVASQ